MGEVQIVFTDNAIKVLEKRYLLRDDAGITVETPFELFDRVAACVAQSEAHWGADSEGVAKWKDTFASMMKEREFMPNSPTLMNAGKPGGQLSACFVLPVPDTLEGIFETCKNAALIHKTGGGTGFSFSRLRPANDRVASTIGVASGPVSFMTVYDAATEAIRQGGTRRGANMGMLRVDHPDIERFITAKRDTDKLNNFNISVAITDSFMSALDENRDYELLHPGTGKVVSVLSASKVFEMIVENAHATGEPGIVFIDRINQTDPLRQALDEEGVPIPGTEDIEATNPCGEQPLGPGDACNLGSINLSRFILEDGSDFDWKRLGECVETSVRFLDDVIDANNYPLEFIRRATLNNRRIGLGVMGWAEALILLGISYDSEKALSLAEKLMSFVQDRAHQESRRLAVQRGVFPNWEHSVWSDSDSRVRNATVTTIAPTGTISIIAGTSSGIEPIFAVSFLRRVLGGMELVDVNPLFEQVARDRGFYSEELMQRIAHEGTVAHIEEIPEDVRRLFVCAHDIAYSWHVRMQAAFQAHTDNAVSKTINFPETASLDDIRSAYQLAWNLGLKGITVYRDASRRSQVLNIKKTDPLSKGVEKTEYVRDEAAACHITAGGGGSEPIKKSSTPRDVRTARTLRSADTLNRRRAALYTGSDTKLVERGALQRNPRERASSEKRAYHSASPCPECGFQSESFVKYEACLLCLSCGYTRC